MSTKIERYDIWTEAEDDLLLCCVLDNVSEGKTQLKAFERAGKELGRTADACGYRWNAILRKQFKKEMEQAKKAYLRVKEKQKRKKEKSTPKPKKATAKQRSDYEKQAKQYAEEQQKKMVSRISPVIEVKEYTIRLTKQEMYALGNGSVPQDLKAEINRHFSK
jgi:RsfA family transcription factor